jgi:hypothetical protein
VSILQDTETKLLLFFAEVAYMDERRSEPRINMMARIEALWQDEAGSEHVSRGKIEDLSDGGLCIRVKDPISVGSKLTVRFHLGNFPGTVVQSRKHGQDYVLGIKRDAAQKLEGK